jgi:DNA polymerase I
MKTTLTCGSCVDLPSKFDRFREVWGWDTEFRPDADHRPDLVTLFAKEIRSGRTVRMRLADLIATGRLPFGNEPDTLVESYSAVAELACCLSAGVAMPANVLCTYAETSALINGLEIDGLTAKRPTLLEACDLFAIEHMDKERKDAVRDLIREKAPSEYTSAEWALIEDYNAEDVETDIKLFLAEAATIDLAPALFRGQYSKTVACMEHVGVSVDAGYVGELSAAWPDLRMHYIHKLDSLRLYDDEGHFCEDRMAALIEAREWFWPVKPKSGKYALDARTFGQMTAKHPELKRTQQLRDQIAELRLGAFVNTIGADGHSRCPLMPWWTRTSRNQPSGRDLVYLLSLPAWVHGVIRPPEG